MTLFGKEDKGDKKTSVRCLVLKSELVAIRGVALNLIALNLQTFRFYSYELPVTEHLYCWDPCRKNSFYYCDSRDL